MSEDLFRLLLPILAIALYINHHVIHRRPSVRRPALKRGKGHIELWILLTASAWTLMLIFYTAGLITIGEVALPLWARWFGVGAMALCAPLSQWTYQTLGANFSKKLELQDGHRLIQDGPYRLMRHPMYATLFLCAGATCLISANYIVMMSVAAVVAVFLVRIRNEETMLIARFGNEYREYRQRTWALIPRLSTILR